MHIGPLSHRTVEENGAEHLGSDGYFLFEASDEPNGGGIVILSKFPSVEAALRLLDILGRNPDFDDPIR